MNLAGLVRLSFELDTSETASARRTGAYTTGRDFMAGMGRRGTVGRTWSRGQARMFPDTSAFKRKRVKLPDGRTVYRVVRPSSIEALKRGRPSLRVALPRVMQE